MTIEGFELLPSGYKSIWRFAFDTEALFRRYSEDDLSPPHLMPSLKTRGATTPLRHTPSRNA